MHNNEFEKRVGHKLEELKFTPSDAVWQKVEVQIRERKRHRRFFFWWLPAIVLCTGIAGWFIYSLETGDDKASAIAIEKKAEPSAAPVNKEAVKSLIPVAESKHNSEERNDQPVTANTVQKKQAPAVTAKVKVTAPVNDHLLVNQERKNAKEQTEQPVTKEEKQVTPEAINSTVVITQPLMVSEPIIEKKQDSAIAVKQDEQPGEKKPVTTDSSTFSKNETHAIAKEPVLIKKKKIEFDLVFRAGMSGMSQFSEGLKLKMGGRAYASPGTNSPGFPSQSSPSKAKSSAGFTAGIQVKKPVSKRSAFSIGLGYSFYSSSHKTGDIIYADAQFSNSLGTSVVRSYARAGYSLTYKDRYHFIEIPLLYHLQMNKVAKRPILFNGGIAYSYLAGSSAQYYYRATGTYYYDRLLFNRSQLQLRTGISMGLVKKRNYPLQLGLQYQYNISGQWKNALELNQHLSFTGIQLSWRLNNK